MLDVQRDKARFAGVWLDQAGAIVVMLREGRDPEIQHVESNVESHFRLSGGWKSGMKTQDVADEKRIERRRQHQLDQYYQRLGEAVGKAARVLILGPGEAKLGLKRVLDTQKVQNPRRITVRTAERMTDKQFVAVTSKFFFSD